MPNIPWDAIGAVMQMVTGFFAVFALFISVHTFRITQQTSHYGEMDRMYFDLLSHRLTRPYLRQTGLAVGHEEEAAYDVYAYMVWNFVEAIRDRCEVDAKLCSTWDPVVNVESDLHLPWLRREENKAKFKQAFYESFVH